MASSDERDGRSSRRWLRILPVLAWASAAEGQTTGTIVGVATDASTGAPVGGTRVVATGAGLQGEQTATADEQGRYRLTFLPPGPYRLEARADGFLPAARDDVLLRIDKTLRANLVLTPLQVQLPEQVVRSVAPAVDVGKAESAIVVPREAYDVLPLGRTFESAVALAPTARSDAGIDGAQGRENGVLVEGLTVNDPIDARLYVAIPSNFVQQLDVKTGNYLPEHGRVTGGILSAVTRSGSNELHGSVFTNVTFRRGGEPTGSLGQAIWRRDLGSPHSYEADAGFELGGPVVKDRLWFHLGLDPSIDRTVTERYLRANALDAGGGIVRDGARNPVMSDLPGTATRLRSETRAYRFTGKLTWAASEDHTFTLSAFGSPSRADSFDGVREPTYRLPVTATDTRLDLVARWTGRFLEKHLLAEVAAGWHEDGHVRDQPRWNGGVNLYDTPTIRWGHFSAPVPLGAFEPVPAACDAGSGACPVTDYFTGGGSWRRLRVQRLQARAALSWLGRALGAHQVKGGADVEVTRSDQRDHQLFFDHVKEGDPATAGFETYTGGTVRPPASTPADLGYLDWVERHARSVSPALFLQDSWQPVPSLTVNGGLRWEAQDQENTLDREPRARIRIRDSFAPRVQAVWDPSGQGRSKVAAAWGRYYETIPLAIGTDSFGNVGGFWTRYAAQSCPGSADPSSAPFDPRTCAALVPGAVTDMLGNPATVGLLPATAPVAPGLKGQYLDQFGATIEHEILSDLSLGIEYQGRRQGRVVEDVSSNDGISYFIANPGEGRPFTFQYLPSTDPLPLDPRGSATRDPVTRRSFYARFPRPERSYDGVTVRATKGWSSRWLAFASYTWSKLRGNYPGPAAGPYYNNSPLYDVPTLLTNRTGLLPNDRTHLVKLFAARRFDLAPRTSLTLGAGYTGSSGMPVSAMATQPPPFGGQNSFLIPRGMAGRTPFVSQLDVRLQIEIALRTASTLRLRVDVLNALDARTVTEVDQRYTTNAALPIVGEQCRPVNALAAANPAAALVEACPDLAYLRNLSGRPVAVNPNYGQPTAFQAPRSYQAGVELSF